MKQASQYFVNLGKHLSLPLSKTQNWRTGKVLGLFLTNKALSSKDQGNLARSCFNFNSKESVWINANAIKKDRYKSGLLVNEDLVITLLTISKQLQHHDK